MKLTLSAAVDVCIRSQDIHCRLKVWGNCLDLEKYQKKNYGLHAFFKANLSVHFGPERLFLLEGLLHILKNNLDLDLYLLAVDD